MRLLGLEAAAQVVALQGLSTYAALASAYFFARPVLRGHAIQSSRDLLSDDLQSEDAQVRDLAKEAGRILSRRAQEQQPHARVDNMSGLICLVASFLLLSAAIGLQVATDPNLTKSPDQLGTSRPDGEGRPAEKTGAPRSELGRRAL